MTWSSPTPFITALCIAGAVLLLVLDRPGWGWLLFFAFLLN